MRLLQPNTNCSDLNAVMGYNRPFLWRARDVHRNDCFLTTDAATSMAAISDFCRSLPGRPQGEDLPLHRAFSRDGVCATDLSRKLARHRSMPPSYGTKTVSHGHSQLGVTEQPFKRERKSRLAYLCRVRSNSDSGCPRTLRKRFHVSRSGCDSLRTRLNHNRSLYDAVSVGAFSPSEKCGEDAYTVEPMRRYSRVYPDIRGQYARCQRARPYCAAAWSLLCDGQGLPRLRATLYAAYTQGVFRYPSKKELSVSAPLLASSGSKHGSDLRSKRNTHRVLSEEKLSGSVEKNQVPRSRRSIAGVSDKRLFVASSYGRRTVQGALADRTLLQMDQATPSYQSFLWHQRKRRQNTNLDCGVRLPTRGHHKETFKNRAITLHNSTDFERLRFRENAVITGLSENRLHK
jgi:hypothetical protein